MNDSPLAVFADLYFAVWYILYRDERVQQIRLRAGRDTISGELFVLFRCVWCKRGLAFLMSSLPPLSTRGTRGRHRKARVAAFLVAVLILKGHGCSRARLLLKL